MPTTTKRRTTMDNALDVSWPEATPGAEVALTVDLKRPYLWFLNGQKQDAGYYFHDGEQEEVIGHTWGDITYYFPMTELRRARTLAKGKDKHKTLQVILATGPRPKQKPVASAIYH
jgi:hypothetical protein